MIYFKKKTSIDPIDPTKIDLLAMIEKISDDLNISTEVIINSIKKIIEDETKSWYRVDNVEVAIEHRIITIKLIDKHKSTNLDIANFPTSLFVKIKSKFKDQVHILKNQNVINSLKQLKNTIILAKVVNVSINIITISIMQSLITISNTSFSRSDSIEVNKSYYFLLVDATSNDNKKIKLTVTRNGNKFLSALLAMYIPEINNGSITVKSIFRINGVRSIVSIFSAIAKPIACCVGHSGSRILAIQQELSGEKIIWIHHSYNLIKCIISCLRLRQLLLSFVIKVYNDKVLIYIQDNALHTRIGISKIIIEMIENAYCINVMIVSCLEEADINKLTNTILNHHTGKSYKKIDSRATIKSNNFITQLFQTKPSYMLINMLLSKQQISTLISILLTSTDGYERTEKEIEKFISDDISISERYEKTK